MATTPETASPGPGVGASLAARPPTPLWAVLAFTFTNSLGTGAVTNGIYFLTDSAFEFSRTRNYWLGLVLGVIYVAGSLGIGPGVRRLARMLPWLSQRGLLVCNMMLLGLACLLPRGWAAATGEAVPPEWTVWVVVVIYAVLTGALWPIVESFLSGGRRATKLRRATGLFNVFWSGALVVAFWAMAPLMGMGRAIDVISALGLVHLASIALLRWFTREPARHLEDEHEPHPAVYRDLLIVFRWLLPTSYVILSTLSPLLPSLMDMVGASAGWAAPLAATWMSARVITFVVFERWHGWHGRWWVAVVGLGGVLTGFGCCLLAPSAGAGGMPLMLIGLALFGGSQGLIYLGALYYAMEVGSAEVDAGGMHEALIGVGYTAGPLCGLLVGIVVSPSLATFEPVLLGVVAVIAMLLAGVSAVQIVQKSKQKPE